MFGRKPLTLPTAETALPGRSEPIVGPIDHFLLHRPLLGPYPADVELAYFAMGCFWGAERKLWQAGEVWVTAVGYMGGITPNPTYEEVCSGRTGHTEAVLVAFDPESISYANLLTTFWENHDPTQGMRQGNDVGTQYRSAVYTTSDAQAEAVASFVDSYGKRLAAAGYGPITTEIADAGSFYFAEDYHQQYLAKNPGGYCGIGGTGVACQIGLDA